VQEFTSIAAGLVAMDAMVKAAPVLVLDTLTVCPGRLVVLITGDVASVGIALEAGRGTADDIVVLDELFIPNLHPGVMPAIAGPVEPPAWDALGALECLSVTAGVAAADRMAKDAPVTVLEVRLAGGMGGKSTVKVMGPLHEVETAMRAGEEEARSRGRLCAGVIIARPHPDIAMHLGGGGAGLQGKRPPAGEAGRWS
jgi:microcompartment protein CcmL/EutN